MVVFDFSLVLFGDMLYYNKVYERDVVDMIDNNTQFFRTQPEKTISVEGILEQVYLALKEKGYNPVNISSEAWASRKRNSPLAG